MGLYIEGMKMPSDGEKLYMILFSDGKACASYKPFEWHEVISVPQHGDLIERDKLREKEFIHNGDAYAVVMSQDIRNAPTIIPADTITAEEKRNDKQGSI